MKWKEICKCQGWEDGESWWRIETNGGLLCDRPKPTLGCSAIGRRRTRYLKKLKIKFLSFFLSFFLPYSDSFCLLTKGAKGYRCTWSHSVTYKHSVRLLWIRVWVIAGTLAWQHTTLTLHKTSMPPVGFKPAIPAGKQSQTHALECMATGIGQKYSTW